MTRTRVSRTPWKIDGCPMTYYTITRERGGFVAAWPTKGQIYFARLDGQGDPSPPAEIKTPGRSGMRTGMLALSAPDGSTLVAWKKDDQTGWQLYDAEGRPSGAPGRRRVRAMASPAWWARTAASSSSAKAAVIRHSMARTSPVADTSTSRTLPRLSLPRTS